MTADSREPVDLCHLATDGANVDGGQVRSAHFGSRSSSIELAANSGHESERLLAGDYRRAYVSN
jgi:hypothetical protein